MSNNLFDDDDTGKDLKAEDILTEDQRIAKLPEFSQEKICEIIVCNRYFGTHPKLAIACMEELANRRIAGDTFDFETYIDKSFKELPKLDFQMPELSSIMRQFVGKKK